MGRALRRVGGLLLALHACAQAATLSVLPNGSGEYPTIQAAVEAASDGDIILLGHGVFSGIGNRDILLNKRLRVTSEASDPADVVIDCSGSASEPHRGFTIREDSVIEGITVIGGHVESWGLGGAAVYVRDCDATIAQCILARNGARYGGAAVVDYGHATFESCTFYDNLAWGDLPGEPAGAALAIGDYASASLTNCIIAFGTGGGTVLMLGGGSAELFCADIYGNEGGDYVGAVAGQLGVNGNISEDPLFCDPAGLDLHLHSDSPCAPGGACGLIGALPVACGPTPVETGTWGAIKALYRSE